MSRSLRRSLIALATIVGSAALGGTLTQPSTVFYGAVSAERWSDLQALGWQGNPTDGKEALYPPSR